jgi:HlyD family secretion protein
VHRDDSGVILLGTPIATLGDPTDLEIVVDVLSTQAVRVFQGDPARIEHWGGNEPLDGVVRVIEPSAFLKVSTLGVEEKRVNVIIDFTDPFQDRSTLGDGYRVEAKIIVDETPESSLSIPVSALFREGNGWRAYRVTDGVAELAMLKVGRSDGSMIEVVAGLEKSDRVIMYPSESIRSGVKVIEGG